MAFLLFGPGIGVVTLGPTGSSGKKGASVEEDSIKDCAAATAAPRLFVADARYLMAGGLEKHLAGLLRRLTERNPLDVRRKEAIVCTWSVNNEANRTAESRWFEKEIQRSDDAAHNRLS